MNVRSYLRLALASAALMLVIVVAALIARIQEAAHGSRCLGNLGRIELELYRAHGRYPRAGNMPPSLSCLAKDYELPLSVFVCPSTKHKPGDLRDLDKWTDYIYVVGPSLPERILIICPPLNHGQKKGYALGYPKAQLSTNEFEALMTELYARTNLAIAVSDSLSRRSGGRLHSRPTPGGASALKTASH